MTDSGAAGPTSVPSGPGTATFTWVPSHGGWPQSFSGTVGGLAVFAELSLLTGVPRLMGVLGTTPFHLRLRFVGPHDVLAAASSPAATIVVEASGTFGGYPVDASVNIPWGGGPPWFTGTVGDFIFTGEVTELNVRAEPITAPGTGDWMPDERRTSASFTVIG